MNDKNSKGGLGKTLWNALALNANFYENARNTPKTHRIALTIVILAALSHTLGSAVILLINRVPLLLFLLALVIDSLIVVVGYFFGH